MKIKTATLASALTLALFGHAAEARTNVNQLSNGNYIVTTNSGCVVSFNKHRERMSDSNCSRDELHDAERAVDNHGDHRDYRDEDDYGSGHSSHGGGYWEIHGVSDNKLRIWGKPSKHSELIVGGVHNGEKVRDLGNCEHHNHEDWCEVEYKGDRGWVMKKFLRETSGGGHGSSGHHEGHHSSHNKAQFKDLEGARASSADSELTSRGFKNVDYLKSGNTPYTIWYNRDTRQCLQMATVDGRADSIMDIQTHPKCH